MGGGSKDHLSFPSVEFRMQSERPANKGKTREAGGRQEDTERQGGPALRLSIFVSSLSF